MTKKFTVYIIKKKIIESKIFKENLCKPNPCLNDGQCQRIGELSYVCSCHHGYFGSDCEMSGFILTQPNFERIKNLTNE